ncbi:MAG TPA: XRE family transcriptional regulator [Symbiobacteriaceae bacterium]|nr:XRE family transcriptional regulator [Symbiobacteriaceae bacterium]
MAKLDRRRVNPQPANQIGKRVREARKHLGLSQMACAEAVQKVIGEIYPGLSFVIDQTDISRIESETRPVWDYELRALAKDLLVSSDWLLGICR